MVGARFCGLHGPCLLPIAVFITAGAAFMEAASPARWRTEGCGAGLGYLAAGEVCQGPVLPATPATAPLLPYIML